MHVLEIAVVVFKWLQGLQLHTIGSEALVVTAQGSLSGVIFLPAKSAGEDTLHTITLLPCGDRENCPPQGAQKTVWLLAYGTGAWAPAADSQLFWPFPQHLFAHLTGATSHFSWQNVCILFHFWTPTCNSQSFLTCSCFMLSRSTVLTLTLALPPSSPSWYFTIQNIVRAKQMCPWLCCSSVKMILYNKVQ